MKNMKNRFGLFFLLSLVGSSLCAMDDASNGHPLHRSKSDEAIKDLASQHLFELSMISFVQGKRSKRARSCPNLKRLSQIKYSAQRSSNDLKLLKFWIEEGCLKNINKILALHDETGSIEKLAKMLRHSLEYEKIFKALSDLSDLLDLPVSSDNNIDKFIYMLEACREGWTELPDAEDLLGSNEL